MTIQRLVVLYQVVSQLVTQGTRPELGTACQAATERAAWLAHRRHEYT